jgi:hypothetical protein
MITKEDIMSVNFVFDLGLEDTAKRLCHEYWSYVSPSNYIAHLKILCYDNNRAFPKNCVTAYNPLTGE